jgi:hypothetical protein
MLIFGVIEMLMLFLGFSCLNLAMESEWQERGIDVLIKNLMQKFDLSDDDLIYQLFDEKVSASAHWLRLGDAWGMKDWELQQEDSKNVDLDHQRNLRDADDQGRLLLSPDLKKYALTFEPQDDSDKTHKFFNALKEKCKGDVLLQGVDQLGGEDDNGVVAIKADNLNSIARTLMRVSNEIQVATSRSKS